MPDSDHFRRNSANPDSGLYRWNPAIITRIW
jgi:hypothetical protein